MILSSVFKKSTIILMALILMLSGTVFAEEAMFDFLQVANMANITQPPQPSSEPPSTLSPSTESESIQETARPNKNTTHGL